MVARRHKEAVDNYADDVYDEELEAEELEGEENMPEASWADALQESFGSLPWWIMSIVLHGMVLILAGIIWSTDELPEPEQVVIPTEMAPPPPLPDQEPIHDIQEADRNVPLEEISEQPVILTEEVDVVDKMETENNMDNQNARGEEDAISDIPCGGKGVVGSMGLGGGGGGAFGFRGGGGRRRAAMQGGGSKKSEITVNNALEWLYRHQESDGRWDGERVFEAGDEGSNTDPAVTGLALLAFLGAGHSETLGEKKYQNTVKRALRWLAKQQKSNGSIGHGYEGHLGYNHAISGLALAEAAGMGGTYSTKQAAQKAIDYAINIHVSPSGGWRYNATNVGDISVTGWFVMMLKSAKMSGLKVDARGFQSATVLLDACSSGNGETKYRPSAEGTITTTAIGVLCRQFMGISSQDPFLQAGAHHLSMDLPKWDEPDFYYWYYGTLVMFQMGGDFWKMWNASMHDMLIENQRKGEKNINGSWDPIGAWCSAGGRVYSTAMACLCLEVYYRYKKLESF